MKSQSKDATYEGNLKLMGVSDLKKPVAINIYPKDFEAKEEISRLINEYNESAVENEEITYTDYIGLMMSSVSIIINAISYVLIGFVSISLVVSSIMIGVITYISVLERTKEIGILRSIGASKKDISRVFNAETFIVGLTAGIFGVGIAALIDVPINLILAALAGLHGIAVIPWWGAIGLVVISVALTLIAGIIPSGLAAKKDPVIALRTE
jgi:putative ABC transport system permease protein